MLDRRGRKKATGERGRGVARALPANPGIAPCARPQLPRDCGVHRNLHWYCHVPSVASAASSHHANVAEDHSDSVQAEASRAIGCAGESAREKCLPQRRFWESERSKPRQPFVSAVEIPPANPHIHSIDYTSPLETPIWRFGAVLVGHATWGGRISCRSSDGFVGSVVRIT